MREYKGCDLDIISQIKRNGKGVRMVKKSYKAHMQDDKFKLSCLSLTEGTFIAFNFNAFVVRLKPEVIEREKRTQIFTKEEIAKMINKDVHSFEIKG